MFTKLQTLLRIPAEIQVQITPTDTILLCSGHIVEFSWEMVTVPEILKL